MKIERFGCLVVVALAAGGIVHAGSEPVVLTFEQGVDGFTGFEDTSIYSENGDNAGGGFDGIFSGTNNAGNDRRALLRVDLSSIPEGATVLGAELRLVVDMSGGNFGDIEYTLHRVTSDWGEGDAVSGSPGGFGAPAGVGDATWTANFFGESEWTNAGGDFVESSSATATLGAAGYVGVFSGEEMTADVQDWIDEPSMNFGWLLKSTIEGQIQRVKRIHSSEAGTDRPVLTLTVMLPDSGENPEDLNGDMDVNAVDVQLVINGALGLDIGTINADVDDNMVVNAVDVQLVINAALGL